MVLMFVFWISFYILSIRLSTQTFNMVFIQPVLILVLSLCLIKVAWYNKKQEIKTGIKDIILILSVAILLFYGAYFV